ncbi:hypothetical protein ACIBO2_04540 [Nonomuraea sp. NPDC050022]|uniref:hypothetical protein n=1 Tax=unclassified Nonomuraea TaxID=2593643 RepID=UPI0034109C53
MRRMTIGAVLIVVAGCATGGTGSPRPTEAGTPTRAETPAVSQKPTPAATREACHGTPLLTYQDGFPEVQGTSRDAEVWGLLFAPVPFNRGKEVKIVWRMTGEGPLKVTAALPDGTRAKPTFGPEQHGGSSWRRPGEEWGTGFVFPKAGCYRVNLTRTRGSGHLWLPVR